jgi:hypothetical protein
LLSCCFVVSLSCCFVVFLLLLLSDTNAIRSTGLHVLSIACNSGNVDRMGKPVCKKTIVQLF